MKIVLAPDSFKECAPAATVAAALAHGIRCGAPQAEVVAVPMADGGEGTVDALASAPGSERRVVRVSGPLGAPLRAAYAVLADGTAVIECAAASGLMLVPPAQRDPRRTTSRGTGELLVHALESGARRIILGLGGSATNDGGAGMAQALGFRLLDASGADLPPGGAALAHLARIDASGAHPALQDAVIRAACDVNNPLTGPQGASAVFGPQKGATPAMVAELDAALAHFSTVLFRDLDADVIEAPGAGAAGGLGAGVMAFLRGQLTPGFALIACAAGLRRALERADLVITGEGRADAQTLRGKTPAGVLRLARELGVPAVVVAGALGEGHEELYTLGAAAVYALSAGAHDDANARREAFARLTRLGELIARAWRGGHLPKADLLHP
jgi:glycerate kinase